MINKSVVVMLVAIVNVELVRAMHNFADVPCGRKMQSRRFGRVVGGSNAEVGEFPWLVSVTRRGGHFCGGTLLSKTMVLTAGHCMCSGTSILRPEHIQVTIGQHDLTSTSGFAYEVEVRAITIHPDYSCKRVANDIALLELTKELVWSFNVLPACLPDGYGEIGYERFDSTLATVAGWGWTNEDHNKGGRANVLQKAAVNVLGTDRCREWYKSQGKKTKIQDTQMCAGYENGGIDSCWADSGGPLMARGNDQVMVIGVVSTGIGCARPFLPGLYTRVSEYIPWIKSVIREIEDASGDTRRFRQIF